MTRLKTSLSPSPLRIIPQGMTEDMTEKISSQEASQEEFDIPRMALFRMNKRAKRDIAKIPKMGCGKKKRKRKSHA